MQTAIAEFIKDTPQGREADEILRKCVHCGFCNATCPTYQILGDELDGPRGRIYLIKRVLEGTAPSAATQLHLDRCLTCRNCETTCPSGVRYGRLVDIGRGIVSEHVPRPPTQRFLRRGLRAVLPYRGRFRVLLGVGRFLRPLLPASLRAAVPERRHAGTWPGNKHPRTMLVLEGCVQPEIAPQINAAAARVLDRLGVQLLPAPGGCCGALSHHLDETDEARRFIRANIDAWWSHIERGAEAIVMTASGCGAVVKEYGYLMQHDPAYAEKARRVSELTRDLAEVMRDESPVAPKTRHAVRVAFQSPCTLQHGQGIRGVVENILAGAGFELVPVPDGHLCCGSAGTYSLLQREIAEQLRNNKTRALMSGGPTVIATANIGCLTHLQTGSPVPVKHWIELLAGD